MGVHRSFSMKVRPEDDNQQQSRRPDAQPPVGDARSTPARVQPRPVDPDEATTVSMRPIDPDEATTVSMRPIDPDEEVTLSDPIRSRRHILAHGIDDPDVDRDQLAAISFESSMPTFAPQRHESAYFDEQPSMSLRLPAVGELPAEEEALLEEDQPSTQMRALKSNTIMLATMIITGSFIAGRILGLLRGSLFAGLYGTGVDADAYTQAFYIPDTIFNLVAGGALSSAFIPVFTQYLVEKRDKKTAYYVANAAFNSAVGALTILAIIAMILAPKLIPIYVLNPAPGEVNEIVLLIRIMLLQPIFLGGSTVVSAILQTRQRFLLPAIGTVLYNVGLILGLCATLIDNQTHIFGGHLGILGATWGVVLGAALQFLVQVPGVFAGGLRYKPVVNFMHPGVRNIARLMAPRILNAAMLYLAFGIDRGLASLLSTNDNGSFISAATGFFMAFQLMLLPISIFAMAVSTAAFPTLATLFAAGQFERLRQVILTTLRGILLLSIPASLGLIGLARPIVRLLYQHGNFTAQDTNVVYQPLVFLAIGIAGHAAVEILTRSFYALRDSRTPVYVSLCQFAFMIGLSIILFPLGLRGLGLAMSIGVLGEATALLMLLRKRLHGFDLQQLFIFIVSVLAASLVSTLAALVGYALVDRIIMYTGIDGHGSIEVNLLLALRIGAGVVAAAVVYFSFIRFLGIDDALPIINRFARRIPIVRRFVSK
jgi:putative peptidoglycan lipid II flippase